MDTARCLRGQDSRFALLLARHRYNIGEVKRPIPLTALVALVIILAQLPASTVSDTGVSLIDSNIPDDETATDQTEASDSSASATITITMYAVADE